MLATLPIGDVLIHPLLDSPWSFRPGELVPNVDPSAWRPWLHQDADDLVPSRVLAFACRTPTALVLVDAGVGGWGYWPDGDGALVRSLAQAGARPSDVDFVLITHPHPDHVGGGVRPDGTPAFENARYLVQRRDWDHFTDAGYLARAAARTRTAVESAVLPLASLGVLDLVEPDHAVTSEIDFLPTPGHTPGSVTVRVRSGGSTALMIGDAAHHHAQLGEPAWSSVADLDPDAAADSRRRIVAEACRSGAWVAGAHFERDAPVFARVTRTSGTARWNSGTARWHG